MFWQGPIESMLDRLNARIRFLEEIMRYTPRITLLIRKELRTCHVENLPPIEPHCCVPLPIRFFKMRPYFLFARVHLG